MAIAAAASKEKKSNQQELNSALKESVSVGLG